MKTLAYFLNKVCLDTVGHVWFHNLHKLTPDVMQPIIDEAANLYAQQVGEDVRQRCLENAAPYYNEEFETFSIDKNSILNIEIILP